TIRNLSMNIVRLRGSGKMASHFTSRWHVEEFRYLAAAAWSGKTAAGMKGTATGPRRRIRRLTLQNDAIAERRSRDRNTRHECLRIGVKRLGKNFVRGSFF